MDKKFFGDLGITDFMRPTVGIFDLLDILIVAYVIYKIVFFGLKKLEPGHCLKEY